MAGNGSGAKKGGAKTTAKTRRSPAKQRVAKRTDGELRLTSDRLVVRSTDGGERKSTGGLLIPATAVPAPRRLMWGDVTLAGPDVRVAKQGDRVLFLPSAGLEVEIDGEDLILLRERDVQAVTTAAKADRPPGQYL